MLLKHVAPEETGKAQGNENMWVVDIDSEQSAALYKQIHVVYPFDKSSKETSGSGLVEFYNKNQTTSLKSLADANLWL